MPISDQLMKAMDMFGQSAKEYGIASGIRDATDQMQQLKQNAQMDVSQKYAAQKDLASALQGRLSGLGATGVQIANAVGAVSPPDITTVEGARQLAATSTTPADRMEANKLVQSNMKAVGDQNLAAVKPTKLLDNALAGNLLQQRLDGQKELLGMKGSGKLSAEAKKDWAKAFDDINPDKAKSGNLGKLKAMMNTGGRIDALFQQFPDYNVPKAQTHELASTVAALVSGGSIQSQKQLDSITPTSLKGDAAGIAGWLTNNPKGLEQQAFMKNLHETAKREVETASNQLKASQMTILNTKYNHLKESDPQEWGRRLKALEIDPAKINSAGNYDPAMKPNQPSVEAVRAEIARRAAARAGAAKAIGE